MCAALCCLATAATAAANDPSVEATAAHARVQPVVLVRATKESGPPVVVMAPAVNSNYSKLATGSGFIADRNGRILTTGHLVDGARSITVTFVDGSTTGASVVKVDKILDVAVLQVSKSRIRPATLGSSSALKSGDALSWVYLKPGEAAKPTEDHGTVTSTNVRVGNHATRMLRVAGTLTVGVGGAPVFDASGKVVAMITQLLGLYKSGNDFGIERRSPAPGVSFGAAGSAALAVPVNDLKPMLEPSSAEQHGDHGHAGMQGERLQPAWSPELPVRAR